MTEMKVKLSPYRPQRHRGKDDKIPVTLNLDIRWGEW
jgi:hypothetical protein